MENGKLKLRFLRFGRPQKVDPPLAENNKGGLGFTNDELGVRN